MRFDVERARAHVHALDFPRFAGTDSQRRAADYVAEHLEQVGFQVARHEVVLRRLSDMVFLGVVVIGLVLVVLNRVVLDGPRVPWAWSAWAMFIGIGLWWIVLMIDTFLPERTRWFQTTAPIVIGRENGGGGPAPRVVLVTHLDTAPPRWSTWYRWTLSWIIGAVVVALLLLARWVPVPMPPILLGVLGLGVLAIALDPWNRRPGPHVADNRSGLAVLLELARTWTALRERPVSIAFVALGGHARRMGGLAAVAERLIRPWPRETTLVLNLEAPGLGASLGLVGGGLGGQLAEQVARSLWLPYRTPRYWDVPLDHRHFRLLVGVPSVSIVGDLDADTIQPPLLAAAAQLAIEMALRWARLAESVSSPHDESRPRSSQNPG